MSQTNIEGVILIITEVFNYSRRDFLGKFQFLYKYTVQNVFTPN